MKNIKKHKKTVLLLSIIILLRILLSYNLPSFYLKNLYYDDNLTIEQVKSLIEGNYLGEYSDKTLIKGMVFPLFLALCKTLNISYTLALTIIYILACSLLTYSLKENIKNKKFLLILYVILLFNPISYSSEIFQRLYRNSLSISLTLIFFSFIINIINSKSDKKNIINAICLGFITSIMFLTREDNIWCIITIFFLIMYKFISKKKTKTLLINLLPIVILFFNLNVVSLINYKYYNVYTYNELEKSSFNDAYIKILEIKSEHKYDTVSITKNDLKLLVNKSKKFKITEQEIDIMYREWQDENTKEINNGNMVWALRKLIYKKNQFKDGKEANKYFEELAKELDLLFKNEKIEKEFIIPSIFINTPTKENIKKLPKNIIKTISYTTSYKNIKSISKKQLNKLNPIYEEKLNTNGLYFNEYHDTENIVKKSPLLISAIQKIYCVLNISLSIVSIIIVITSIKKFNKNKIIIYLVFISYLMIISGVAYTETTAFTAIRYFYLGNTYILQTIFIALNINELKQKKR